MEWTVGPLRKRPRDRHSRDESSLQEQIVSDDGLSYSEDSWGQGSLFALDAPPASDSVYARNGTQYQSFDQERKRGEPVAVFNLISTSLFDEASLDYSLFMANDGLYEPLWLDTSSPLQAQVQSYSQEILPSVPWEQNRWVDLTTPNPFAEDSVNRHSTIGSTTIEPPQGVINSYVKVRFWPLGGTAVPVAAPKCSAFYLNTMAMHHRSLPHMPGGNADIPRLPPDFGRELKLDQLDSKLFKFYTVAFCRGRTLLPKTNFWLVDIAPMASGNTVGSLCVKHAMLSLAAAYFLDYAPSEILRERANLHYQRAVDLLSYAICDSETEEIGKGDSVIGALILLMSNDIVNWELRRPKGREQRWRGGSWIAKSILTKSNPNRRYRKIEHAQRNSARISNANWVAYADILAQSVTPLKIEDTKYDYSWLLAGSEREQREIHGGTGVCPKILHTFAQITRLAAVMVQTPDSMIIPYGAEEIERRLIDFRQFSDFSDGCETRQALLDSCRLNFDGKVNCPAKVTELTAETWVAAAQIYLYCRFFRKPRSAAVVAANLDVLLRCVERMPMSGPLFTSQSPFFPIFLAGLVSYRDQDRQVICNWFQTIVAEAGCRSSVPPVWSALRFIWHWMDTGLVEGPDDDQQAIGQKQAWWEDMVAKLMEEHGEINLC